MKGGASGPGPCHTAWAWCPHVLFFLQQQGPREQEPKRSHPDHMGPDSMGFEAQ